MGVRVRLPDTGPVSCPKKCTVWELAQQVLPEKAHNTVGAFINEQPEIFDLRTILNKGDSVQLVLIPSLEALQVIRHSAAHVMAQAVQELWPDVKVTIGPVIDSGFYYDFDTPRTFQPEDLKKIETRMKEIIKSKLEVTREKWNKEKAIGVFEKMGEHYKTEIIHELEDPEVFIYRQSFGAQEGISNGVSAKGTAASQGWFDLCRGPHVKNISQIGAIKILYQSGAYWRGDESKQQLQRIYGTAFHSEKELKQHLQDLEAAARYDHRRLGKEMELFHFSDLSPGSPFFTSRGTVVYNELKKFLKTLYVKYSYEEVITPQLFGEELFQRSGHKEHFADNMYPVLSDPSVPVDKQTRKIFLKPMNCPGHCLLYGFKKRSYRDLPWRVADFGRLHRREKKGALHGLTRVNSLCQDDAHIFCMPEQLQAELKHCLDMFREIYHTLGLRSYQVALSTQPKESMGEQAVWRVAEDALMNALKAENISFKVQQGEGAFYGPKLDWHIVDAMRRPWQLGTVQCDFNMPRAFRLKYMDKDNTEKTPILLHRAVLGSLERFMGVYLEHVKGYLPLWLSPVSVLLVNISKDQEGYVKNLEQQLQSMGIRVRSDLRGEKLGYKVRESRLSRQPCLVVIGEKEKLAGTVSVRPPDGQMFQLSKDDFIQKVSLAIQSRKLDWVAFLKGEQM